MSKELKETCNATNYEEELNKEIIAFNKRFADGEQYISYKVLNKDREDWEGIDPETREPILEIKEKEKDYYWQENAVYNLIPLYISRFIRESNIVQILDKSTEFLDAVVYGKLSLADIIVYGKFGLVDMLIPFQRAYNAVKNRKMEFLNRYTMGILCVEDGSVDVSDLETDGVTPGKVIIYRQGSVAPEFKLLDGDVYQFIKAEEDIRDNMDRICNEFIDRYSVLPSVNARTNEEGNLDLSQWISTTDSEMSNTGNVKATASELDKLDRMKY